MMKSNYIHSEITDKTIKAYRSMCSEHKAQLLNYLKATKIELGMLLNFGEKPQFKRKVFSNRYKISGDHKES